MKEKLNLSEFTHGGDIYSEGFLMGREFIDFSSNINPLGVPKSFTENIDEGINCLNRYPDIKYRQLKKYLRDYLKDDFIKDENIILGNGAAEVIDLVISSFRKILIVVPSFSEYELNAEKWGCQIEYSYLKEDMDIDYADVLLKQNNSDAMIIGNPNNPNGALIDKVKFKGILDFAENNKKTVIIDEAFIEFTANIDHSFQNEIREYNCIFIIRALTKFFALPGIRFGYGISGNVDLVNKIKVKQLPWNINCFAELAVKYVLSDKEYIKKSIKWIKEENKYLPWELEKIKFIDKVFSTAANFVLCRLKNVTTNELHDFCMDKEILIRKASNFRGLDERYVRFAIKDRKSNDIMLKILHNFKEN
jgi:threonine-phosphate decarboxylase